VGPEHRLTIVGALARHARARPNEPFLTEITSSLPHKTVTYAQAHQCVRQRVGLLGSWGLKRGETVGVLGYNSIDFVLAVLAALEAGGVIVLLSPQNPPVRTAAQVELAQVRFLLHDHDCAATANTCRSSEQIFSFENFEQLARSLQRSVQVQDSLPKPTDAALILFTSGTSGAPKAVVQSHYSIAQNAFSLAKHHSIKPGVRFLCVLPLHHVNGLEFTIFSVMLGGGHTVISRRFDGLRFWTAVREHGIQIASLVPNLLGMLADRPGLRGQTAVPLRYAVSAAAPLSIQISDRVWRRLGLRIVQGYGLSEVSNFSCLMPAQLSSVEYERWMLRGPRTSIGPTLAGQEVEVHTGNGLARAGQEGEIVIRGHCVMSGYLNNAAATEDAFRGGWFHTGDLGYFAEDDRGCQYFHVSGRIREIAKRSGVMVSLLEVDEALASIPGVSDAGSANFENDWVGEEIAAVVVREHGSTLTQETIVKHCLRVLPFSAVPKAIEFVEEIPRTASGKILRAEIGERFVGLSKHLFLEAFSDAG
jgi:acyl-CoA synthetase (AMP-forming)/AMP-acid ligase II